MKLKTLALTAALSVAAFAATSATAFAYSAEAITELNVRDEAAGDDIRDVLYEGEVVEVIDCDYGWCEIEHKGPDGYVSAAYLDFGGSDDDEDDGDDDYYDHDDDYGDDYDDVDVDLEIYADNGGIEFGVEISN